MKYTDEVFIEITTWMGISLGATHYYGVLKGYLHEEDQVYTEIELKHILSQREANKLNKESGFDYLTFEKGDLYGGFNSRQDIIAEGMKIWKVHFPLAHILVQGEAGIAEPQLILAGPFEYKVKVNNWYLLYKGEWTNKWEKVCDEFWKYHNTYEIGGDE